MAASREHYRPPLISERLVLPLTLCRAAATGMAWAMATLGESVTRADGREFGNAVFTKRLKQARTNTGEPLRPGYNQSHMEDFMRAWGCSLKLKDVKYNKKRAAIRESLQNGYAITLAGNVGSVANPLSKLNKYVNPVGHELIFFDWQGGWRTGSVAFIDPMTPVGVPNYVRRVPVLEMWQFGSYFQLMGIYGAERWKIGKYTRALNTRREMAGLVLDAQTKLLAAQKGWSEADAELDAIIERYNTLDAAHTALMDESGVSATVEAEVALKLQKALDLIQQSE